MASWTALNILENSDSESEVADNTLELQIEEALKLYQKALKHHCDKEWDDAAGTYEELFKSEIFQQGEDEDEPHLDNILYLAYTGRAEFMLDKLKSHKLQTSPKDAYDVFRKALDYFVEAISRDKNDPLLWRKVAQLAKIVGSSKIARFALEGITDAKTGPAPSLCGIRSPDELVALFELKDMLEEVSDDTAIKQSQVRLALEKRPTKLLKHSELYPWAVDLLKDFRHKEVTEDPPVITLDARTWAAVGAAIQEFIEDLDTAESDHVTGPITLTFPGFEKLPDDSDDQAGPLSAETNGDADGNAVADEDTAMGEAGSATSVTARPVTHRRSMSLSNKRKSSASQAEAEAGNVRLSKRIRNREATEAAAAAAVAPQATHRETVSTTGRIFTVAMGCFQDLDISIGTASSLRPCNLKKDDDEDALQSPGDMEPFVKDFKKILMEWDDEKGNVVLYGEGIPKPDEGAPGMSTFDSTPPRKLSSRRSLDDDQGLVTWLRWVNKSKLHISEVALSFLLVLLKSNYSVRGKTILARDGQSSYMRHIWPDALKDVVKILLELCEDTIWQYFKDYYHAKWGPGVVPTKFDEEDKAVVELAQTIFEITLDHLASSERERITLDSSNIDISYKKDRVRRWGYIMADLTHIRPRDAEGQLAYDSLTFRYLWSAVLSSSFFQLGRDFLLDGFDDIRELLKKIELLTIELPNCSIIPEISIARAEREISKVKTMDFFASIFASALGNEDPVQVIEELELVLDPRISEYEIDEEGIKSIHEMTKFLDGSNVLFKLLLWQKLREAYESLGDTTNVMRCRFHALVIIMGDLTSEIYIESSQEHRFFVVLRTIYLLEDILAEAVEDAVKVPKSLEETQPELLKVAMKSMCNILRLLHVYAFHEDAVVSNEITQSSLHSYRLLVSKLRQMVVRAWTLMYLLYKASLDVFLKDLDEVEKTNKCTDLVSAIHEELGVRHYCKLCNHLFLKVLQEELLRFDMGGTEIELVQCIQCRFGLDLSSDVWLIIDHKSDLEPLDRDTAIRMVSFFITLVDQKKSSAGMKADLKAVMDKLISVIGEPPDTNSQIKYNRGLLRDFLNSPIQPLSFFNCLKGEAVLNRATVRTDYAEVAEKGLYLEQATNSLTKFRYLKKTSSPRVEEIEFAIRFFKHDLVCDNTENWETWYRLAQSYEHLLEDDMTWNAEKINNKREDLIKLERRILLCYMMAASGAARDEDYSDDEMNSKQSMFTDFGIRLYSSIRAPLSAGAFALDDHLKYYSATDGVYQAYPHQSVSRRNVLDMAVIVLNKSIDMGSTDWKNYYYLGKCEGKLDQSPLQALEYYAQAIKSAPSRDRNNEPTFEVHHRLISATYKYVEKKRLTIEEATKILKATPYATEDFSGDEDQFVVHVQDILIRLRKEDKAKWHHRMTHRLAYLYLEQDNIQQAFKETSQFFSNKNNILSIWKPDNERPGRHFVYAYQYLKLWLSLLADQNDKTTLENLAKKLKKGLTTSTWRHFDIWADCVKAYTKVLRHVGEVPENNEEKAFQNVSYDEFNTYSQKIEERFDIKENQDHKTFEILRDTYDLKKLNTGLAKTMAIEDLLADCYAKLYAEIVPEMIKQATAAAESSRAAAANPMSLKNLMFDDSESNSASTKNPIALAAAHSRMDDIIGRGKITKVVRKDIIQKVNSLFKNRTAAGAPITAAAKLGSAAVSREQGKSLVSTAVASPIDTPVGSPGGASSPAHLGHADGEDTGMDTPRDADKEDNADSEAVMTPG